MTLKLYAFLASGPCRMAAMTLEFVGKDFDYKTVDLFKGEQNNPEYLKLNPQHSVPTLVDGDFVLTESRAIVVYIADVYGKETTLWPNDPKIRARIEQRLYFEMGTFYQAFGECAYPVCKNLLDHVPEEKLAALKTSLGWMSDMLQETGFFAGTIDLSLADIVFMANFASLIECQFYPNIFEDFPALKEWFEKCKKLIPNYEKSNGQGAKMFGAWFNSGLKK